MLRENSGLILFKCLTGLALGALSVGLYYKEQKINSLKKEVDELENTLTYLTYYPDDYSYQFDCGDFE